VTAALCLAGCGGGGERHAAPQPKLPARVASELAQRSDAVAAALLAGDSCRALDEARALQQDTIAAVNDRRVPAPFQEPLLASVNDLLGRIVCVPPADEAEEGDEKEEKGEDDRGKGNDKNKGKKGRD
jgi:hypothetical protein